MLRHGSTHLNFSTSSKLDYATCLKKAKNFRERGEGVGRKENQENKEDWEEEDDDGEITLNIYFHSSSPCHKVYIKSEMML